MPSLKMSYGFLPSHLKRCFSYCSLFPKDYVLEPRELVHLWMAQGYVNPLGSKRTIEEAGQDHFMELLSRGFFQDVEKEMYGNIVRCKMHYLMHDLAQSVAGNECITIDRAHEIMPQGGARHVSIIATEDYEWNRFERDGTIRSLLLIVEKRIEIGHLDISCFRNLRALRLQGVVWDVTFDSISELKHLRSLDLSKNDKLISLPNSISRLCNLETLNLRECLSLQKLPRGITKLVNLRQLDVSGCSRLTHMPRGIGKLTGLQMLSTFVVGAQWNSDAARFNELSKLTGLRNELAIQNLERSASISSEEDASCFMENFALQYLGLHWVWKGDTANERVDLERFRPHPDLRGLRIEGYSGVRFSSWVAQLDKLVVIEISDCPQCRYLPPLDDLHSLKRISLETLRNLEWIELSENSERLQSNFFPSLEEIELKHLDEFKGWRTGTGTEGEEHIQDEDDSSFFMLPIFSDKIKLSIDECPRFSYMHCQRLQLRGTTNKILQQLLRDVGCHATVPLSSQFTMAVPTPLMMMMMTSISYMSLSTLTSITIESVGDAKHLPVELFQSLPSLQSLAIKCWPCLKDASVRTILRCLTALKTLEISDCRALDLSTEDGDHSDDDDDDEDLHARRLQGHSKLQLVHIRGIHKMESLPWWFQHLSNLQELRISLCLGLKSLPGGVILRLLKTVRSLELHSCPELDLAGQEPEDQEDMPNLLSYRPTELQKLVFSDIRKMTTVPWWIQHLNNLEQLTLAACRNLKALPYWFPQLTSLKYLRVEDCGELSRRLKSNIGEDWPKISQIQSVSTE
ncbi:putative disease resistance protein RGA4 isoform X2 [Punica granatum]|nr:putative disease resistance protein RGA4 isoform X2 [Punica granatum]